MGLKERFELLELRRNDGIQTFHAREIATARPVQVHVLSDGDSAENRALLARLEHLPEIERLRIVAAGDYEGMPYVVTDRLAGYPGFREWLMEKTDPTERNLTLDLQFQQLFDPNAETATLSAYEPVAERVQEVEMAAPVDEITATPAAQPAVPDALRGPAAIAPEPKATEPKSPSAAKSILAVMFGILAAILLLVLIILAYAFRPR